MSLSYVPGTSPPMPSRVLEYFIEKWVIAQRCRDLNKLNYTVTGNKIIKTLKDDVNSDFWKLKLSLYCDKIHKIFMNSVTFQNLF